MDVSAVVLSGQTSVAIPSSPIQYAAGSVPAVSAPDNSASAFVTGGSSATPTNGTHYTSSDGTNPSSIASETDSLKKSAATLNQNSQPHFGSIEYTVDQQSNKLVLKVVDQETKQVLLQIPSKEALILSETIGNGGTGSLIHESA